MTTYFVSIAPINSGWLICAPHNRLRRDFKSYSAGGLASLYGVLVNRSLIGSKEFSAGRRPGVVQALTNACLPELPQQRTILVKHGDMRLKRLRVSNRMNQSIVHVLTGVRTSRGNHWNAPASDRI